MTKYNRAGKIKKLLPGTALSSLDVYSLTFTPDQACYVYIFPFDSQKRVTQLFPNPNFVTLISVQSKPTAFGRILKKGAHTMDTLKFWDVFLSKKENFNLMKKIVNSSFPNTPEIAEEALSYVSEKILVDNKKSLQDYDPHRNATAYFCFVIRRLIRDFRVEKWGRFRPPKSLLKQPNFLLVLVYKLLCWEKMPEEAVVEQLKISGRDPDRVEEDISIIRDTYKNCEIPKLREIPIEDDGSGVELQTHNIEEASRAVGENPEDSLLNKQLQYLVRLIFQDDSAEIQENYTVSEKINTLKKKLKSKFRATDKDRLFLRMVYFDGLKVPEAGRKLKWSQWRSYGKHRRLLTQLRALVKVEDFM